MLISSQDASGRVIDNFDVGTIGTPSGRLDTSLEAVMSTQITSRDFVPDLPESAVIGTTRAVFVSEDREATALPSTAEILRTISDDGFVEFEMGSGGSGAGSYARPDDSALGDFFGGERYDAFRFRFLSGTSPGNLTVSPRGDFPDGGNQLIATAAIPGPGLVDIPFSTLMGEFGGPPGRLGLPNSLFFSVEPLPSIVSNRDQRFRFLLSEVSLVSSVPEPRNGFLFVIACSLVGFIGYRTRATSMRRKGSGLARLSLATLRRKLWYFCSKP
ncbi:MAG: hypothetical protein AAF989_09620 [Planctomycetota bacterium]